MGNAPLTERELLEAILAELQKLNASAASAPTSLAGGFPDGRAPTRGKPRQGGGGEAAPDSDLDGQWGDPTIRKDPPRWQGQSYAGMPYSEAPADYLEVLAGFLDWAAGKAEEKNELTSNGKPRADYLRKDAARARGWALRAAKKGGGWRPPAPKPEPMTDDDVPFLAVANEGNGGGYRGGVRDKKAKAPGSPREPSTTPPASGVAPAFPGVPGPGVTSHPPRGEAA